MDSHIIYTTVNPDISLADFVDSFWMLKNVGIDDKEVIILPDARIDMFFTISPSEPFRIIILGIGTAPENGLLKAGRTIFAISFTPLGVEYLVKQQVKELLNTGKILSEGFCDFSEKDLTNFEQFCEKAILNLRLLIPENVDVRKKRLFELIHGSNGALSVRELSEKVCWSSRQINRYFNQQLGIPLKVYCNLIRFRASFRQLREGKLFPEQNFSDQAHFIREIKKLAGVIPKELSQNQNDRFIQLSLLSER